MWYMSEKEFNSRLEKIQAKNLTKERKAKLKEEKEKYKPKRKLPSTSKLVLLGSVLLCLEIVIFCEYMILTYGDTNSVYALIGLPATLVPIILGYYNKSKSENTIGGITYDMAMFNMNQDMNGEAEG